MMRVLHLTPDPAALNGISEYATQFAHALTTYSDVVAERVYFPEGVHSPDDIADKLNALKPSEFDIIHAEIGVGTNSVFYGAAALSREFGNKLVVTLHDAPQFVFSPTLHRFGYRVDGVANKLVRKLVFDAAFNAFVLPAIAARIARYVVLNRGAVPLVRQRVRGADVRYAPLLASARPRVVATGAATNVICYGFVARAKGIDLAIRALRMLHDRGARARLTVIGGVLDEEYRRSLEGLAVRLGVDDAVSWSGYLAGEELDEALARAGVVVLPYRESGSMGGSAAVVQVMEYGLPVLLSRTARFSGEFVDGEDALMFHEGDAVDLADKLLQCISDEPLRRRLASGSRRRIEHVHAPAAVARTFRSIYNELA